MSEPTLLGTIAKISDKVNDTDDSHWHFATEAPRWAVRSPEGNTVASVVAGATAFLLATSGFWLAWHATDKLAGSQAALAVQIGPWAAVAALLAGACVAAYVTMGTGRLHLRMTQLAGDETAAKALAASASGQPAEAELNGTAPAARKVLITAAHAAEADNHATAPARAAGETPAAAPTVASAQASPTSAPASAASPAAAARQSGTTGVSSGAKDPAKTTSPKVWATSIAGAISFSFWTIAAATFWKNTFSSDALAALVGATTTIVAAAAGYHLTDPLRTKPGT